MTDTDATELVYKICTNGDWNAAVQSGAYRGSADDQRDGFIHLSSVRQLRGTADKHFSGQTDLVLISVNSTDLGDRLKWEPSRGGQLFPHCYGDLPISSAIAVQPLTLDPEGRHVFPDDVREREASDAQQASVSGGKNRETD